MPPLIFDSEPQTWQELEELVCQAFDEMGYESARNVEILTVRGTVRVDVHAIKKSNPIPTQILCECKHWNKPVEKGVIHGFRSICSDVGAHYGLIISRKGFQSGASKSSEHTNIHLLSFMEFQATFFNEWRAGIFMRFARMYDALLPIIPLNPNFIDNVVLQRALASINVFDKYDIFFGRNRYSNYFIERKAFPVEITDPRGDPTSLGKITIRSPRQYFEIGRQGCADARSYFGI